MKNATVIITACIGLLIGWLFLLLPFEIYDEQSHYASVHYLVENGKMPNEKINDLSVEEEQAERFFGVMTDGTNVYARNPAYRPEITNLLVGKYEAQIGGLNTPSNRNTYTIHQAAIYPPLYYVLGSLAYRISYSGDLITRVYATRVTSLFITLGTIIATYYVGYEIFRSRRLAMAIMLMTAFYPMTTFIGVGVNSDNLHNLLFTIFLFLTVKQIRSGLTPRLGLSMGIVIGIDLLTKPQAYIMIPIALAALIIRGVKREWPQTGKAVIWGLLPLIVIAGWQEIPKFIGGNPYIVSATSTSLTVMAFLRDFVRTAASQLIVWYWGVFKWNTILMPKVWWWVANRLVLLAGLGIVVTIVKDIWSHKLTTKSKLLIFAILANGIYLAALVYYDWQYVHLKGRSLGFQARYFMPLLSLQMSLLLMGLRELGWNEKVKEWIRRGVILFFVGLQVTAIYTVAQSYYDVSSLQNFIIQASQYKPWFAKGGWWYIWIAAYLVSLFYLTWTAIVARDEIQEDEKISEPSHSRVRPLAAAKRPRR